jgi:cytochrome c oxidase cbb3-type subunit 4
MNFTYLSSVITVLLLFVFIGIVYWAYSRGNKARFDALAKLPLDEEDSKERCAEIESIRK